MKVTKSKIPGLLIIEPDVHGDSRGFFMETWHHQRYAEAGIPAQFVQDNLSRSSKGVLRGLHYQLPNSQGKLVWVLEGEVFDVGVDIRRGSPTFGKWDSIILSSDNKKQFYVPPGFAHGFEVLSETALFCYKCTDLYHPEFDKGILWNDPAIGISWHTSTPSLSEKDSKAPLLANMGSEELPVY